MNQLLAEPSHLSILQDSDRYRLSTIAQPTSTAPGTVLIEAGTIAQHIYLILEGSLNIILPSFGSEPFMTLGSGEIVGETSLLDENPSPITIVVGETSQILALPKQALIRALKDDPDFSARFHNLLAINLSERLRQLSKAMAIRNIKEGEPLRKVLLFFATLNDSDVAWLVANGTSQKSTTNTILIEQNQAVPAVYLLLDGTLGIYININNQEKFLATRVKGDLLGEMSFIDGGNASATVKALEHTWVLAIPQPQLAAKLKADEGFATRFYRAIAQIMFNRCQDLFSRAQVSHQAVSAVGSYLSEDIEIEDEIDFDVLDGTAIAGTRFDWMIQQLRR
jgi:bacteriocin-type transport-associated protein